MAREREHRYLVTINSLVINILSIVLFIGFGYFIYYYIVNLSNIDIEGEFIKVLNIYGNNICALTNEWIKECGVYINGIVFSLKKEENPVICNNIDESGGHHAR